MNIEGLDYNTQRKRLILPEYGRDVQKMIDYAIGLEDKQERQTCAETIIEIMARVCPPEGDNAEQQQTLWDHLAIMSEFKLDIDYPVDVSKATKIVSKPEPMHYPMTQIPVRHYGHLLMEVLEKLKTMEPGDEREQLVRQVANLMKMNLASWSHGSCDDEKVASDLARYTDGNIQLDLDNFKFDKIQAKDLNDNNNKKKKKK